MQRITSTLTTITDDYCNPWFVNHSLVLCPQMEMNLTEIKDFFTDEEWDAIDCALSDYQDYGEEESILSDTIKSKIHKLFN